MRSQVPTLTVVSAGTVVNEVRQVVKAGELEVVYRLASEADVLEIEYAGPTPICHAYVGTRK